MSQKFLYFQYFSVYSQDWAYGRYWLTVLCEGSSSPNNVWGLGGYLTISSKASSTTAEYISDYALSFEADVSFFEMSEPVLCYTFIDIS